MPGSSRTSNCPCMSLSRAFALLPELKYVGFLILFFTRPKRGDEGPRNVACFLHVLSSVHYIASRDKLFFFCR